MFLTQVNREFEERQEDGSDRAFPRQSDVYGGDAAAMFSETILLLNKPSKYGVSLYGRRNTDSCIHVDTNDLFAHIVKNRNSEGDFILHYKENFKKSKFGCCGWWGMLCSLVCKFINLKILWEIKFNLKK